MPGIALTAGAAVLTGVLATRSAPLADLMSSVALGGFLGIFGPSLVDAISGRNQIGS